MILLVVALAVALARAADPVICTDETAVFAYARGLAAQRARRSADALAAYEACLTAEPGCVPCLWEKGWAHWTLDQWDAVVAAWTRVQELQPSHPEVARWLANAQRRLDPAAALPPPVPIGTRVSGGGVTLTLVARFQGYRAEPEQPGDTYDPSVNSPKSVRISRDGAKAWVNALEGYETIVYDARALTRTGTIRHVFGAAASSSEVQAAGAPPSPAFDGAAPPFDYTWTHLPQDGDPNHFKGKPVESALSHADRYLWVPYYRRDFDTNGTSPSAVAIVDTRTDRIVRVLATGPVPKFVAVSPDDSRVAVTHWGDNTVMLVDTSSGDPATFRVLPRLLVAESRLPLVGLPEEVDRDEDCGFCLRGAVFTPDGRTLLVGRMAGGGVAGFDVEAGTYLGTVTGMRPTPRHLVVAGEWLYLSANSAGWVARVGLDAVVRALRAARGRTVPLEGWQEVEVGGGARTLEVTADGRFAFVAVYNTAELAVIDTSSMTVAARIGVDPFPVGLDIAPDGTRVWTTSQGFQGMGGNSVGVYDVSLPP